MFSQITGSIIQDLTLKFPEKGFHFLISFPKKLLDTTKIIKYITYITHVFEGGGPKIKKGFDRVACRPRTAGRTTLPQIVAAVFESLKASGMCGEKKCKLIIFSYDDKTLTKKKIFLKLKEA